MLKTCVFFSPALRTSLRVLLDFGASEEHILEDFHVFEVLGESCQLGGCSVPFIQFKQPGYILHVQMASLLLFHLAYHHCAVIFWLAFFFNVDFVAIVGSSIAQGLLSPKEKFPHVLVLLF